MGCGGSRADAIEPRYQESWTRETESTWLTSTDGKIVEARPSFSFRERRVVNTGIQCGKQPLSSGICANQQRRSRHCCLEQAND
ncbi:brain and acute leukemia cytoplasmic protein isoform X2 [Brachyhypopomus gauderio]|uniref:brain and acute leukemia cytoplasmic protein isoform X2 n=1 Tax=Brachyhypopomus gauderio TaxID=698409 RepID=UPI004043427D